MKVRMHAMSMTGHGLGHALQWSVNLINTMLVLAIQCLKLSCLFKQSG